MSLSYNQVIKLNREFSDAHYILKNFGNGAVYEILEKNQTPSFKYPLMFMEDLSMPIQDKVEVFGFRVFFMSRVAELEERGDDLIKSAYNEAKSDMLQCAKDFISYWKQDTTYPEFNIVETSSRETFQEEEEDRLTGCFVDVQFRQAFKYSACNLPMAGITPPPSVVCLPVTVTVNSANSQDIASGGSLNINVEDTAGNDVGTFSSNTQTIADVTQTLNGASITNNKAETSKAITIRYADDSPVTVTTIIDTESVFLGEVPNVTTPINTANLFKTGQTSVIRTGDDGDLQEGRGSDWWTCGYTNPFYGGNARFRGNTGGYTDGTNYFDVNDNATTKILAFPNDEMMDWVYYDQVNGTVPMWYINPFGDNVPTAPQTGTIGGQDWEDAIDGALASTQNSYTDWYLPNAMEVVSLINWEQNINDDQGLNWKPLDYNFTGSPTKSNWRIWTSTANGSRAVYWILDNGILATTSPTTASYTYFIKRNATLANLGL